MAVPSKVNLARYIIEFGCHRARLSNSNASVDELFIFQPFLPITQLLLGFVLGQAVRFLYLDGKVVTFACNDVKMIVGELAPLLLHIAFELLPVAFDAIPVHFVPLMVMEN